MKKAPNPRVENGWLDEPKRSPWRSRRVALGDGDATGAGAHAVEQVERPRHDGVQPMSVGDPTADLALTEVCNAETDCRRRIRVV